MKWRVEPSAVEECMETFDLPRQVMENFSLQRRKQNKGTSPGGSHAMAWPDIRVSAMAYVLQGPPIMENKPPRKEL